MEEKEEEVTSISATTITPSTTTFTTTSTTATNPTIFDAPPFTNNNNNNCTVALAVPSNDDTHLLASSDECRLLSDDDLPSPPVWLKLLASTPIRTYSRAIIRQRTQQQQPQPSSRPLNSAPSPPPPTIIMTRSRTSRLRQTTLQSLPTSTSSESSNQPGPSTSATATMNSTSSSSSLSGSSSSSSAVASTSTTTPAAVASTSASAAASAAGPSTSAAAAAANITTSNGITMINGIPEGVDPSFLAALPMEMREEVIAEHVRQQRIRMRTQANAIANEHASIAEVNPEFLAALPLSIQEEVLAQQRIEQQRQADSTANPEDPVDAAAFFENLQPSLRQQILADMEDSQISALPPDLAAEAQTLRRDYESRNRHLMQEQAANDAAAAGGSGRGAAGGGGSASGNASGSGTGGAPTYSSVLRYRSRLADPIFGNQHGARMRWTNWSNGPTTRNNDPTSSGSMNPAAMMATVERQGRPLLDHESLASLLILLFIDEPKFNTLRLHRVIRNLGYHVATRNWLIWAMISIVDKSNETTKPVRSDARPVVETRPQWLNFRLDSAMGNRNNIFVLRRPAPPGTPSPNAPQRMMTRSSAVNSGRSVRGGGKPPQHSDGEDSDGSSSGGDDSDSSSSSYSAVAAAKKTPPKVFQPPKNVALAVHPQAAQVTCRHALNMLISLAKTFPITFLPNRDMGQQETEEATTATAAAAENDDDDDDDEQDDDPNNTSASSAVSGSSKRKKAKPTKSAARKNPRPTPSSSQQQQQQQQPTGSTEFWDILLCLEASINKRRRADVNLPSSMPTTPQPLVYLSFSKSPFGRLTAMLSSPLIRRNSQLTDKLLRLLSFISNGLPDLRESHNSPVNIEEIPGAVQTHLRLVTEAINSKSCTEEGLEDAATLFLNLSQCSNISRNMVMCLLIECAVFLAGTVRQQIAALIVELREMNNQQESPSSSGASGSSSSGPSSSGSGSAPGVSSRSNTKGVIVDRFTKEQVVLTAAAATAAKQKATHSSSHELQLPAMVPLIAKGSNQSFFLRILKVMIQIRENIRTGLIRDLNRDRAAAAAATATATMAAAGNNTPSTSTANPPRSTWTDASARQAASTSSASSSLPSTSSSSSSTRPPVLYGPNRLDVNSGELAPLSEILHLDNLWETLSTCLVGLEETADQHAVLVLEPAVEAFFLVHASPNSRNPTQSSSSTSTNNSSSNSSSNSTNPPSTLSGAPRPSTSTAAATTATSSPSATSDMAPVSPISRVLDDDLTLAAAAASASFAAGGSNQYSSSSSAGGSGSASSAAATASSSSNTSNVPYQTRDQRKFLAFAEKHRTVLNQILRQSTTHLSNGPFAVLVDHTRILDFDVKRQYFRVELERMDEGVRREELAVHVHRVTVFEDSFRELYRRNPEEWKNRFYIVFEDEEGQDAGGLLREWYVIISREIFNPMYALFTVSPGDRVTYMINQSSHANSNHLFYFKFVGRVIAKAIYDNKLLECYFTRSFYKHILGIEVNTQDMESEDYEFYKGLVFLMENHITALGYDLTFSLEVNEFGVTEVRDLIANGRNVPVTEQNKMYYIHLVCQMKMSGSIKKQLASFLEGFYDIIPKRLISIFNEQELELLISGLPNVDIEDLKANTEYHKYQANSIQIQWFWRALRSLDQAERAKFLQFVTGTSKVPLQGFAALEGMNGTQKFQIHRDDRSTERLPSAHTCFNQLDLPVYKTFDKLRSCLLKAIHECSEGFGFA